MQQPQLTILEPLPPASRYLTFRLVPDANPDAIRDALSQIALGPECVVGVGLPVVARLGGLVPRLRVAPHLVGDGVQMPSTPGALWVWLRGEDRGALLHKGRSVQALLDETFELDEMVEGFMFDGGRDLSGYEDGTENPTGDEATNVAFVSGDRAGFDGWSFVAAQIWEHNLDRFQAFPPHTRDHIIGRRIADNEEIDDAPEFAHVKRTAQEDFTPEAFVLRRSMPFAEGTREGLVFVAFAASFDPFEALCRRMVGLDDGVVDGLFKFTRPVGGAYYGCPPMTDGKLDLSALASA